MTKGDFKTLPLTIYNHSDFMTKLILDIRYYEEFEILVAPTQVSADDDVHSEIIEPDYRTTKILTMVRTTIRLTGKKRRMRRLTRNNSKTYNSQYSPAEVDNPRNFALPFKLYGKGEMVSLNNFSRASLSNKVPPKLVNFRTKVIDNVVRTRGITL